MTAQADRRPRKEEEPAAFRTDGRYLTAVVLSWLIPGAGHWLLGQRRRAAALAALLLGTFWWGEVMAGGYAVIRAEHPYFFYAQVGNGLSAWVADRYQWAPVSGVQGTIDRSIPRGLATGILLSSISGILNVVLILHVMDPRSWESRPGAEGGGTGGAGPGLSKGKRR